MVGRYSCVIVYEGKPSVDCTACTPQSLVTGMNRFLAVSGGKQLLIVNRRVQVVPNIAGRLQIWVLA